MLVVSFLPHHGLPSCLIQPELSTRKYFDSSSAWTWCLSYPVDKRYFEINSGMYYSHPCHSWIGKRQQGDPSHQSTTQLCWQLLISLNQHFHEAKRYSFTSVLLTHSLISLSSTWQPAECSSQKDKQHWYCTEHLQDPCCAAPPVLLL